MNMFKNIVSVGKVSLLLSAFTLIAYHIPVFTYAANNVDSDLNGVLIMGGAAIIMLALNYWFYYTLLYITRILGKIILSLMFIGNSVAFYFINIYKLLLNKILVNDKN